MREGLFESFFAAKERGKGSGLGLATVYGIVKQCDGYIWVHSEIAYGSTLKVYLPRVDAPVEAEPARSQGPRSRGSETILLVENEGGVRVLAQRILEGCGYTVPVAATGEEAVAVAQRHRNWIGLIPTDVVLPGPSGRQLAEQAAPRWPGLKVLYMSGYTDDASLRHGVLEPGIAFLNKPFTAEALVRNVRDTVDR